MNLTLEFTIRNDQPNLFRGEASFDLSWLDEAIRVDVGEQDQHVCIHREKAPPVDSDSGRVSSMHNLSMRPLVDDPFEGSSYQSEGVSEGRFDDIPDKRLVLLSDSPLSSYTPNPETSNSGVALTESFSSHEIRPMSVDWDSQRMQDLQAIIVDLQRRTQSLLQRTKPASRGSSVPSTREPSLEPSSSRCSTPLSNFSLGNDDLAINATTSTHWPDLSRDASLVPYSRQSTPCATPYSDSHAPYDRSWRSNLRDITPRARSEPPISRKLAHNFQNTIDQTALCSNGSTARVSQVSSESRSQKRKAPRKPGQSMDDEDSQYPRFKRRRHRGPTEQNAGSEKFPCIFHVAEPERYYTHDQKHAYISQLL